jgi:hypothetical protein
VLGIPDFFHLHVLTIKINHRDENAKIKIIVTGKWAKPEHRLNTVSRNKLRTYDR